MCERGYGKRTNIEEFRIQNRGGKGIILIDASDRNGPVVDIRLVKDGDEVMLITDRGQMLRTRVGEIRETGHCLASEALQPVATATTVRVRNGRLSVFDGPFAETKEALAGFYLIEARDLNEAIQLASKIPPAAVGCVEIRPLRPIREQPRSGNASAT